jgi:Circularly permutated YpsA SLOG family
MSLERIVSGGQTGADRAAFDVAWLLGFESGGWVPKGRKDERGVIPLEYPNLRETETDEWDERTLRNVRDSDATLIFSHGKLSGGSELTRKFAIQLEKEWMHVDLDRRSLADTVADVRKWLAKVNPKRLNVAGPRESEDSRIYADTKAVLWAALASIDPNILCQIRGSVLDQCGRWDQIRWQVPSWFSAVGALALGFAGRTGNSLSMISSRQLFVVLGFLGAFCSLLLFNLIRYEVKIVGKFNDQLKQQRLDPAVKSSLEIKQPYDFSFPRVLRTASLWFLLYTVVLTVLLFVAFFRPVHF